MTEKFSCIVSVAGNIGMPDSHQIISHLLEFEADSAYDRITMLINSPGGCSRSILGLLDIMQNLRSPIQTVCVGSARFASTVLVARGNRGRIFALKHSMMILRESEGQIKGSYSEVLVSAKQLVADRDAIAHALTRCMEQEPSQIIECMVARLPLKSDDAIRFGLVDKVLMSPSNLD